MCKMTDIPREERLESDQLRSLTGCEQAIYAIAKKTGKSPLDIWRVNEIRLSELSSEVDFKPDRDPLGIILLLLIEIALLWCLYESFRMTGWYGISAGILVFWTLMNIEIVCLMFMQKLLVRFGKILRFLSGVMFSITSTVLGLVSTLNSEAARLLFALSGVLLAVLLVSSWHSLPELLSNHSVKERDEHREQLSMLRFVRPLLPGGSRVAVESRSSVASCARLRKVVDWD